MYGVNIQRVKQDSGTHLRKSAMKVIAQYSKIEVK
jgi:hypothetical protein